MVLKDQKLCKNQGLAKWGKLVRFSTTVVGLFPVRFVYLAGLD